MGRKELVVKKVGTLNLREVAARATLRDVRQQGHVYVELRPVGVGKRNIFFCTLCLTQCFSEAVLYDHLGGNLHSKRYGAAKITLLLPNPWPFNDGVLFFNNSREKDAFFSLVSDSKRDGDSIIKDGRCNPAVNGDEVTSVFKGATDQGSSEPTSSLNSNDDHNSYSGSRNTMKFINGLDKIRRHKGVKECLSIPGVLLNEEVSDLELKIIGFGHVGSKIHDGSEDSSKFGRIWCAWLGDGESDCCDELLFTPKCDFAIVGFAYTYNLGRKGSMDDTDSFPSPGSFFETDEFGKPSQKRKKSFSDPEDISEVFQEQCSSSFENSHNHDHCSPDDSNSKSSRSISNGAHRDESRKRKRLAAERNCDICRQPMLPGKDVATLLNLKTSKLACSSRNVNGAFHVFHASCLIHWVLLLEFEMWVKQSSKGTRGRKGKSSLKNRHISSVFCPECQGTGVPISGDELEKPTVPLSETFLHKLDAIKAHKAWMKKPEDLQKCSTGLCFPLENSLKLQGKTMPAKLLLFYRADE
ncbi:hypothetical protein AXF42_Ash021193 [Apostasia shenzhenica]|uniref:C2H2-type domain-containing protein n=1 Tax=Apostasia shenzhenica TaxID=1088818 RepID=A0A2I0AXB1_9ASPA|nr:hypothetical protein AXF42_Ash021193 [Apostasia shenzhenica]